MTARVYVKPPWMQRHIANRLVPLFQRSMISRLTVKGRRSGRERTAPEGRLINRGRAEDITVEEVPEADRPPLLAAYRERYGGMPTVAGVMDALPDPTDHPVFRIHK
ncbi:deazaflavin-dependent nitroreductase [Streptomyces canus]|jgi:hypothetical protein|uniref:deazaflavin-dependent nitroreductase n=1 Tax=Streptomyces canus TaxID=58343 RepID=UPI00371396DC